MFSEFVVVVERIALRLRQQTNEYLPCNATRVDWEVIAREWRNCEHGK